ncbi:MAG: M56 family metallopeptidase [Planctomycetaceae bacterium]
MNALPILGGFLATYLVHSTLLIGAVGLALRLFSRARPETRDALWKLGLVGGLATSALAVAVPGFGWSATRLRLDADSTTREPVDDTLAAVPPGVFDFEANAIAPASDFVFDATESGRRFDFSGWRVGLTVVFQWLACLISIGAIVASVRWIVHSARLRRMERNGRRLAGNGVRILSARMGLRRPVDVLLVPGVRSPLAAGVFAPRILLPPAPLLRRLDRSELRAMVAHEMAHIARRDPLWSLVAHFVCHALFFQPLNFLVRRRLRMEAEFLADHDAGLVLRDRLGLARCLATVAEWLHAPRGGQPLPSIGTVGMEAFRSTLGRRVERILESPSRRERPSLARRAGGWLSIAFIPALLLAAGPRITAGSAAVGFGESKEGAVETPSVASATGTRAAASGERDDESAEDAKQSAGRNERSSMLSEVPERLAGFSGRVAGIVQRVDSDGGMLVLTVRDLRNVWPQSTAREPRSIIGRTLPIERIDGEWREVLSTFLPGDVIEIEVEHARGDRLRFLGETLRKREPGRREAVARSDAVRRAAAEHDVAELQGFRGILQGRLVSKDDERETFTVRVEDVRRVFDRSEARRPESAVGKSLSFALRESPVREQMREALRSLNVGDAVEVGVFATGREVMFVGELLRKVE